MDLPLLLKLYCILHALYKITISFFFLRSQNHYKFLFPLVSFYPCVNYIYELFSSYSNLILSQKTSPWKVKWEIRSITPKKIMRRIFKINYLFHLEILTIKIYTNKNYFLFDTISISYTLYNELIWPEFCPESKVFKLKLLSSYC